MSSTAKKTPGNALRNIPTSDVGDIRSDRSELEDFSGLHVYDNGAVAANSERAEPRSFGYVPRDAWRPARHRDDVQAAPASRLDGGDGAIGEGAVRPEQGTVEVGRHELYGGREVWLACRGRGSRSRALIAQASPEVTFGPGTCWPGNG